jgi:hypothetical protein
LIRDPNKFGTLGCGITIRSEYPDEMYCPNCVLTGCDTGEVTGERSGAVGFPPPLTGGETVGGTGERAGAIGLTPVGGNTDADTGERAGAIGLTPVGGNTGAAIGLTPTGGDNGDDTGEATGVIGLTPTGGDTGANTGKRIGAVGMPASTGGDTGNGIGAIGKPPVSPTGSDTGEKTGDFIGAMGDDTGELIGDVGLPSTIQGPQFHPDFSLGNIVHVSVHLPSVFLFIVYPNKPMKHPISRRRHFENKLPNSCP